MKKNSQIAFMSLQPSIVYGFASVRRAIFHYNTCMRAVTETLIATDVKRISVCTEELCQCQGEEYEYTGGASDAALEELQGLGLACPVEEVGCMGACGM